MVNGWKVAAIIFMVLFIAETVAFVYVMKLGVDSLEKESQCMYNVCHEGQTYFFDYATSICYCFDDGEITTQEYME